MSTPPITTLRIQGFKSLVDVQLQPRQLNIFIGKPNVGKSNILEALSLLGAGYDSQNDFMSQFIRHDSVGQLFNDNDPDRGIFVTANCGSAQLRNRRKGLKSEIEFICGPNKFSSIDRNWMISENNSIVKEAYEAVAESNKAAEEGLPFVSVIAGYFDPEDGSFTDLLDDNSLIDSSIKKYDYRTGALHFQESFSFDEYLFPPDGKNTFSIIKNSPRLQSEVVNLFEPYGLQFVLRVESRSMEIQKNRSGLVYTYPYNSIADTFQRLIFYLAAIDSNKRSVLLFEEPEAHSFPTYITQLAERIAEDVRAGHNQYFITTHSPYLLDQLLENTSADQVAVFVVDYSDYQTTIKQVPDDQIGHLLDLSSDVFFNLNRLPLSDADSV